MFTLTSPKVYIATVLYCIFSPTSTPQFLYKELKVLAYIIFYFKAHLQYIFNASVNLKVYCIGFGAISSTSTYLHPKSAYYKKLATSHPQFKLATQGRYLSWHRRPFEAS